MVQFSLEKFNGPLDLLLQLVSENELEISDIALGEVTEQYLSYLEQMEDTKPHELADFLVIASRLLLLKSKNLLPQLMPEEDDGPDLASQLKLYKAFIEASKKIDTLWLNTPHGFGRIEPVKLPEDPPVPENVSKDNFLTTMHNVLKRLAPPKPLPRTHIDSSVTVKEKIKQMREFLKRRKSFSFKEIIDSAENKTEVIVGFLALLELVKQKSVTLQQENLFTDIKVEQA